MWISKLPESFETSGHNQKSWGLINPSGRRSMWLVGKLMWWRERTCRKEHLVVTETTSLSGDAPQTTSALIRTSGRYLSLPSTSLLYSRGLATVPCFPVSPGSSQSLLLVKGAMRSGSRAQHSPGWWSQSSWQVSSSRAARSTEHSHPRSQRGACWLWLTPVATCVWG